MIKILAFYYNDHESFQMYGFTFGVAVTIFVDNSSGFYFLNITIKFLKFSRQNIQSEFFWQGHMVEQTDRPTD